MQGRGLARGQGRPEAIEEHTLRSQAIGIGLVLLGGVTTNAYETWRANRDRSAGVFRFMKFMESPLAAELRSLVADVVTSEDALRWEGTSGTHWTLHVDVEDVDINRARDRLQSFAPRLPPDITVSIAGRILVWRDYTVDTRSFWGSTRLDVEPNTEERDVSPTTESTAKP